MNRNTDENLGAFYAPPEPPPWKPPPWPSDCPEPGIYYGKTYEEYAAWPAVNFTSIKHGSELSPKHMRQSVLSGKDTAAMKFGRATHCRFLEPQTFAERFPVAKPCCGELKAKGREGQLCGSTGKFMDEDERWYCGTHNPKDRETVTPVDYVTEAQAANLEEMVKAAYSDADVAALHGHKGSEVSMVWKRDGLACKGRLDKLVLDAVLKGESGKDWTGHLIIDLKKIAAYQIYENALRAAISGGYLDVQAWWYRDGLFRLTGKKAIFYWVFLEDGPPYDICVKPVPKAQFETGRARGESSFLSYVNCLRTGEWPGVAATMRDLMPKQWLLKRYGVTV